MIMGMIFNYLGTHVIKNRVFHPRVHLLFGGLVGIMGIYWSTRFTNYYAFEFMFSISYGGMVGFTYMSHLFVAWQYFPATV